MNKIRYILPILFLMFLGISCQENYEMIPPPNPDDYKPPRFTTMYMVGSATPNDWTIEQATQLKSTADNRNVFTWQGILKAGEMKFPINRADGWNSAFFMAPQKGGTKIVSGESIKLRYSESGDGGSDDKIIVEVEGTYKLTIDAIEETLVAEKI